MATETGAGIGSEEQVVSIRKVRANRLNALKSTGPRTPRGKAHSRRNALRHGLFAMGPSIYDYANREDHARYQILLNQLIESYEPVGAAEELEVKHIAVCWWKLDRVWRCENAGIAQDHAAVAVRQIRRMNLTPKEKARLGLLERAKSEIESTDVLSEELQKKMFLGDEKFQRHWEFLSKALKERSAEFLVTLGVPRSRAEKFATDPTCLLFLTVDVAIRLIEDKVEERRGGAQMMLEPASDLAAVLPAELQDRVLKAGAAAERGLQKAVDRLERLQRRRLGESVPPPVSVHLSR